MPAPLVIPPPPTVPLLGRGAVAPVSQPTSQQATQPAALAAPGTGSNQAFPLPAATEASPTTATATASPNASTAQPIRYRRVTVADATLYPEPLPSFSADVEAAAGKGTPEAHGIERFLWGKQGFSFDSLLQSLNPLEYIPVVSSIYNHLTGDSIGAVASTIGGGLIGGPIGAAASLASSAFAAVTGDDIGGHIMTALLGDNKPAAGKTPATGDASIATAATAAAANPPAPAPLPPGALEVTGMPWLSAAAASSTDAGSTSSGSFGSGGQSTPPGTARTPAADADPSSNANGRPQAPPDFAERMMEALDKYQAAAKLRETAAAPGVDVGG
ncbi:MAG TPA: hypothetical protein VEJ16_15765 [Alphaproteobacteria bacterium]|nr:hypothetical protein [Alphaproteobacteria bacterium]